MERYKSPTEILNDLEGRNTNALVPGSQSPVPPSEVSTAETESLYNSAQEAYENKRYNEAAFYCREVLDRCHTHIQAKKMAVELQTLYKEADTLYQYINQHVHKGHRFPLVLLLQEASQIYPDHPLYRPLKRILRSRFERSRGLIPDILRAFERWDFKAAMNLTEVALEEDPENPDLLLNMRDLRTIVRCSDQLAEQGMSLKDWYQRRNKFT